MPALWSSTLVNSPCFKASRAPVASPARSAPSPLATPKALPQTPAEIYAELFLDVQLCEVFEDSKTFVDAIARRSPQAILEDYRRQRPRPDFDLRAFVAQEFLVCVPPDTAYVSRPEEDVRAHIDRLWEVLTRSSATEPTYSSRLPMPRPYVVPGGRFNEAYYWDSYFTALGLKASGEHQLVRDMCDNFAHLLDAYGLIPNGNRTYYLSRSQPPVFAAMIELLASIDGPAVYTQYREALQCEYDYWMQGAETLAPGEAHRRVVRLANGVTLNRYWDDRSGPREESFREDVATALVSGRCPDEVYRHLRAGAESGWDFSSRWLADPHSLASIETTDLLPVDLNCLLYRLELTLARAHEREFPMTANRYLIAAAKRRAAVLRVHWSDDLIAFTDYNWRTNERTDRLTAATAAPLFCRVATYKQAKLVASTIRQTLLAPHGLRTTAVTTEQQWDGPNGWAPLQWMVIEGLTRYAELGLAVTIARRWIAQNVTVFRQSGKLVEKYNITHENAAAGGGEYPLQDGFGWTNGVLHALLARYCLRHP
jgi:alpha,alpha-trehalase